MYLFGSIHFPKKDFYPPPQPIEDAYNQSQVVVFEVDLGEMDSPETQIKMLQSGKAAEGETLKDVLSKETYAKLESHSMNPDYRSPCSTPLRPWMVAVALITTEIVKLGYNPEDGVDKYFTGKRRRTKRKRRRWKHWIFNSACSPDSQNRSRMLCCAKHSRKSRASKKDLQGIIDAWKTGDTSYGDFHAGGHERLPQLHKKLLVDRNKQWVDKLQKLHASGKTVFVVVGARTGRKDSVVDLLSAKGLKARQL